MPPLTTDQLRDWYAKFSKELHEKATIDVTRAEDLGRIKNFEIKNWSMDDVTTAEVECYFPYAARNENGYVKPIPEGADIREYSTWLRENLKPQLTEEQMLNLYRMSREGTLMIFEPGASIHNMRQVYTDKNGNIHTSIPMDKYDSPKEGDIPEDQKIPDPPVRTYEPDPRDYFFDVPVKPEPPENLHPNFLSWIAWAIGIKGTDYGKLEEYKAAMNAYSEAYMEFMSDLPNRRGRYDEYQRDLEDHRRCSAEFRTKAEAFYNHHLGKFYAIDNGYRASLTGNAAFRTLLDHETNYLTRQHHNTPRGEVSKALFNVNEQLRYPSRTRNVIKNLVGDAPRPYSLSEWIDTKRVFKKEQYSAEPYELPRPADYSQMSPEKKLEFDKKWSDIAALAGFAAVVDPDISAPKNHPSYITDEEAAQLRYNMTLNDLFTYGREGSGHQHMDILEPARNKAREALVQYHQHNNPEPLAKILAYSLVQTNRQARSLHHLYEAHDIDTLYLVGRLYDTLTEDPSMMEVCGVDPAELEEARGYKALLDVAQKGQRARKALLEHSLYKTTLTPDQLLQAAKDAIFADVMARELAAENAKSVSDMHASPEGQQEIARSELGNRFIQLQGALSAAKQNNDEKGIASIQQDIDLLKEMKTQARINLDLMDLRRPAMTLGQKLRNSKWVEGIKEKLAEDMNLNSLISGTREEIGVHFASGKELEARVAQVILKEPESKPELEIINEVPEMEEPIQKDSGAPMV